jgi:hypothetical protein
VAKVDTVHTTTDETSDVLLDVDDRGRASLARLGAAGKRYLGRVDPDGTIVLEPAVVLTTMEARLHANPEIHAQVLDAMAHPERAERTTRRRRPE